MRIEVYKDWIIRSDERNVILCKSAGMVTDKKTNEQRETFKGETYHVTVEQALESLCRKEILACRATTLKGIQGCYKDLKTMLEGLSKELRGEQNGL